MPSLHEQHMKLVDAVNNAPDDRTRREADVRLGGWLDGLQAANDGRHIGRLLMRADIEQMERGYERPMCAGVFLTETKPDDTGGVNDAD